MAALVNAGMKALAASALTRPAFAHLLQDLLGLGRIHVVVHQFALQHFETRPGPQLVIELRQQTLGLAGRFIAEHFFAEDPMTTPTLHITIRGPDRKNGNEKEREKRSNLLQRILFARITLRAVKLTIFHSGGNAPRPP